MKKRFIVIAGLCALESKNLAYDVANYLKNVMAKFPQIDFYFKCSFDKANRTSIDSFRGIGMDEGLKVFDKIRKELKLKILTDIHCPHQAGFVASHVDSIQIPAFLCRQTDLVVAVGRTGKIVNIKKGQFVAPKDVKHIIEKIKSTGNNDIMITERGTCFGYNNLVVDYRGILEMKKFGYPIIFDATHSQQKPSQGKETGGTREYIIPMALGAIATGVDGLFVEVHPNPPKAKSDSATALHIADVEPLLKKIVAIREVL